MNEVKDCYLHVLDAFMCISAKKKIYIYIYTQNFDNGSSGNGLVPLVLLLPIHDTLSKVSYCDILHLVSDKDPAMVQTENGTIKGSLVSGPEGSDVEEYLGRC